MDDILNLDNPFFDNLIPSIYPNELKLNKANNSDTSAAKRDDFSFDIVNFPFLDGDVPRSTSYGVYISQLIRFARACSSVEDFNRRNQIITGKLLKQGYRYHKLHKTFSKSKSQTR